MIASYRSCPQLASSGVWITQQCDCIKMHVNNLSATTALQIASIYKLWSFKDRSFKYTVTNFFAVFLSNLIFLNGSKTTSLILKSSLQKGSSWSSTETLFASHTLAAPAPARSTTPPRFLFADTWRTPVPRQGTWLRLRCHLEGTLRSLQ